MILERFLPEKPLLDYIESFCFAETDAPLHTRERCLPSGSLAVVINLGHATLRVAYGKQADAFQSFQHGVLHGAFSRSSVIDPTTMTKTVTICFRPAGAPLFLSMPASELTNQVVDLGTLWGAAGLDLCEHLQAAPTNPDRVRLLQRFLLARVCWEHAPHPAVCFALACFRDGSQQRSISQVTAHLGMSPRHFIALFEQAVGLTPKVFCRLLRFQEVLQGIPRGQPVRWADLALAAGYFDQAHCIHDFQAFAGLTPGAYLAQRGEHRNHVPLPD